MVDALKVFENVEAGHRAVSKYRMEEKVSLITAPTLVVAGTEDPFSYPMMSALARSIKESTTTQIKGGMVPMVDQMPKEFATVVMKFLSQS